MTDTETLERPEAEAADPLALTAKEIEEMASEIVDGVYFDLPEQIYHAIPRLSASGLQRLCVSPATFWRGSWLDPDRPEPDEEATKAQILGKAYHCARLEPDQFESRYVKALDKDEFDLTSDSAIKAKLKELEQPQTQGTETIVERARRLVEAGYEGSIYQIAMHDWEAARDGRIPIAPKYFDDIVRDMERLLGCKQIAEMFEGGQSEVSIFWTDEHGIQMKQRIDRLTPTRQIDFKTFDNSRGKRLEQALADAIRYNRYFVTAASYREGLEALRTQGLQIQGQASDDQRKLVAEIQIAPGAHQFWFVFQEKNGVPNLLARQFKFHALDAYRQTEVENLVEEERQEDVKEKLGQQTEIYGRGLTEIRHAKRLFLLYSQVYPAGVPWSPIEPVGTIDDLDFSPGWLEGKFE